MASPIISPLSLQVSSVYGAQMPPEGPKFARVPLDFVSLAATGFSTFQLDLQSWQAQGGAMSMIQSVYVDNSQNDAAFTILSQGSNQVITVKGRTQGYFAIICPNAPKLNFTSVGANGQVIVYLLNFPTGAGQQWATQ